MGELVTCPKCGFEILTDERHDGLYNLIEPTDRFVCTECYQLVPIATPIAHVDRTDRVAAVYTFAAIREKKARQDA